jgi:hypothetical protein
MMACCFETYFDRPGQYFLPSVLLLLFNALRSTWAHNLRTIRRIGLLIGLQLGESGLSSSREEREKELMVLINEYTKAYEATKPFLINRVVTDRRYSDVLIHIYICIHPWSRKSSNT